MSDPASDDDERHRYVVTRELMAFVSANAKLLDNERAFIRMNAGIINAMLIGGDERLSKATETIERLRAERVAIVEHFGFEWDDHPPGWWVPAQPTPVFAATLSEAINAACNIVNAEIATARQTIETLQGERAAIDAALANTNIGGIFDVFAGPADAIEQMALHIANQVSELAALRAEAEGLKQRVIAARSMAADVCRSRAESLREGGMHSAANEAGKCARAIEFHGSVASRQTGATP